MKGGESIEEQVKRIMAGLGCSEDEAKEIYLADKAIDRDEPMEFDLPAEKEKEARKYTRTGTRQKTAYNFSKRERKENATKAGIIAGISEYLRENANFSAENVEITNKEREILFQSGNEWYSITLTYKRNMNKNKK